MTQPGALLHISLVQGGPFFHLLHRSGLTDDAMDRSRRRIGVIALIAWLPLLALSAMDGHLLGNSLSIPFLRDWEVHVRLLLALPLLLAAERTVHQRVGVVAQQFLERQLVPPDAMARFGRAMTSAIRLRDSIGAEAVLLALVYGVGVLVIWRGFVALDMLTWYATPSPEGPALTRAGTWYGYVSLPIFQFLLVRWYFRVCIWMRFLWQVSRIPLGLMPTHPDGAGGLGFLSRTAEAFVFLAIAQGAMLAGQLANRILYNGAVLTDFKLESALLVVLILIMFLGPLLVFAPQMDAAQRKGEREYGLLAQHQLRDFDARWLRSGAAPADAQVDGNDLESLADIVASFERVQIMRTWPFTRRTVIVVVVATLAPMAPLLLTLMPLPELASTLLGMIL